MIPNFVVKSLRLIKKIINREDSDSSHTDQIFEVYFTQLPLPSIGNLIFVGTVLHVCITVKVQMVHVKILSIGKS